MPIRRLIKDRAFGEFHEATDNTPVSNPHSFDELTEGWLGPHWMAKRMATAKALPVPPVSLAHQVEPVRNGGRTLVPASELFAMECSDSRPRQVMALVPANPVQAPAVARPAAGSIEDVTAELLRPVLHQWLDDNLLCVLQRALVKETQAGLLR